MTGPVGRAAIPEIDIRIDAAGWHDLLVGHDIEALVMTSVQAALTEFASAERRADIEASELSLVFTDDAGIADLNAEWRGRDGATNVLSFPQETDGPSAPEAPRLLGDIVLALETVRREAVRDGKTPADHTRHLVIHGFLHLLGYDHETDPDATAMEALEIAALARLGIADPYFDTEVTADAGP